MKLTFPHCPRAQPAVVLWGLINLTVHAELATWSAADTELKADRQTGRVGALRHRANNASWAGSAFAPYSELLAHFIRDARKDLDVPKMPFVIGVMGVNGTKAGADVVAFREAMTAPSLLPEFKGNVAAVRTAPFWSEELAAIDKKHEKVRQMRYFLDSKIKDHANADGTMTEEQKREFMKKFEADLITPAEAAVWKRGASNAGYHYLGCAKTFALMGKGFAEANLEMMRNAQAK